MAEQRYGYNYALIDHITNECVETVSTDYPDDPSLYLPDLLLELETMNEDYLGRYYIDGNWYVDAEGTIPYNS